MHRGRLVATVSAVSVLLALGSPTGRASTPGVGESGGGAALVHVTIGGGDLDVGVLGETSATSNDPAALAAVERVAPLAVGPLSLPALESSSTGPEHVVAAGPAIDLASIATPVPGLLEGSVEPGELRTVIDAAGAVATFGAGASDVGILAGVVRLGTVDLGADSRAAGDRAESRRNMTVDRVEVLDARSLLRLVGLDVTDLPLDVVVAVVDALGVPGGAAVTQVVHDARVAAATLLAQIASLETTIAGHVGSIETTTAQLPALATAVQTAQDAAAAQVPGLQQQIDILELQLGALTCGIVPVTCDALSAQIAALDAQIAALGAAVTAATDAQTAATTLIAQLTVIVADLQNDLNELGDELAAVLAPAAAAIDGLLSDLASVPLLGIDDLEVSTLADARGTAATSSADATGALGAITVGALQVAPSDAADAIDDVLAAVDPLLAGTVAVQLLDGSTSVVDAAPTIDATAEMIAVRLTLTPPDVCALRAAVAGSAVDGTLADLLDDLGVTPPASPPIGAALDALGAPLVCGVRALADPLVVDVVQLRSVARFTAAPVVPVAPEAPSTTATTSITPGSSPSTASAASTASPSGPAAPFTPSARPAPVVPTPSSPAASRPPLARTGGPPVGGILGIGLLAVAVALRRLLAAV